MRVLFVSLNQSLAYGGVERWMMDAAAGLTARGHGCAMLGRPGAPWLRAARERGLRVREDHYGAWVARVARTRAVMRSERPDVVVTKGKKAARMAAWGRATGGGGQVALFFGLTHELDPHRWVDRYTWRRTDAGITVAHGASRWYAENGFGPATKLHALWKGVDLTPFDLGIATRTATREALGLADGELAIGTACRMAWQKGVDQLLDAIRLVHRRIGPARFLVVGDGRERPQIEAAARDLGTRVTFLGQRDDVPALLAALDVFVQPSRQEAMVQTTLEAMAAGRPVVSTRTIGADEVIEDGVSGVLVPPGDVGALVGAIERLASDAELRARLGHAARAAVIANFTWRRNAERVVAAFRSE